jgi:hypothetical protein
MNKLLTIFFLSLVTAEASAQLNTFESGQTIRADEMNENFEYLDDKLKNLEKSNCSISGVTGTWMYIKVDDDQNDYEIGRIDLLSDGSLNYEVESGDDGTLQFIGEFEIDDNCRLSGEVDLGEGVADIYATLSYDAQSLLVLVSKSYRASENFDALTLTRINP